MLCHLHFRKSLVDRPKKPLSFQRPPKFVAGPPRCLAEKWESIIVDSR